MALWTTRRLLLVVGAYCVALAAMIAIRGVFLTPDRYFLVLLVPALVLGLGRRYALDFLPLIVLILLYEQARGLAHYVNPAALWSPWVDVDTWIGRGELPSARLQEWLWGGDLRAHDQAIGLLTRAHFFVPPTLLFAVWLERRDVFIRGAATIVAVSFAAALTFLLLPAAPPWMASDHGLIDPLVRIGDLQAQASPVGTQRSWIAEHVLPNPVAAVPSLHAGYALLVPLIAYAWRPRVGLVLAVYPLAMWFGIVYFADHYVVDVLIGIVYALAGWLVVGRLIERVPRLRGPFRPPLADARR